MKVLKTTLPEGSQLNNFLPPDYSDVYKCVLPASGDFSPDAFQIEFWTVQPRWLQFLFKLRDFLVKPFGLRTDGDGSGKELATSIREGKDFGMMSMLVKSEDETALSLNDKHLKAVMSVYIEEKNEVKTLYLITFVYFHNKLGNVYFYLISPFHRLVVKNMCRHAIRQLSSK